MQIKKAILTVYSNQGLMTQRVITEKTSPEDISEFLHDIAERILGDEDHIVIRLEMEPG